MRRRRKSNGIWLPNHGTPGADDSRYPGSSTRQTTFLLGAGEDGPLTGVVPLLWDTPVEPSEFTPGVDSLSMGEFIKNAYFLKRVVGSIFVEYSPVTTSAPSTLDDYGPPAVQVTVGLFVARAGDADDAFATPGFNFPIGGTAAANTDYNPDSVNCIREPWLWRRTWLLGNLGRRAVLRTPQVLNSTNQFPGYSEHPSTNTGYGSVADGPKVDAKTKRRVSSDDRLWAAVTVRSAPYKFDNFTEDQVIDVAFDLRFFGNPMKDRNRGNF